MSYSLAAFLGIIQGLTEFLPVSSSGHLVLFQNLFGLSEPQVFFDVMLHFGTTLALIVFFFPELKSIIFQTLQGIREAIRIKSFSGSFNKYPYFKIILYLGLASIPTAIIGVLFEDLFEKMFNSLLTVSLALSLTGLLLWLTKLAKVKYLSNQDRSETDGLEISKDIRGIKQLGFRSAILIGLAQGAAITPGLSRSGATICTAIYTGLEPEFAARFSFLLSIPAILGAALLKITDLQSFSDDNLGFIMVGTISAASVGYLSLKFLFNWIKAGKLHFFAIYCWLVSILGIVYSLIGK